jgi:hypothetical protein
MAYKIKHSRKEKKDIKKNKSLNQNNEEEFDILNLPPNCWIDAREEYVFI